MTDDFLILNVGFWPTSTPRLRAMIASGARLMQKA